MNAYCYALFAFWDYIGFAAGMTNAPSRNFFVRKKKRHQIMVPLHVPDMGLQ